MSGFRHFAVVYRGQDEFVSQVLPFVQQGIAADGAVLVAVDKHKIELLDERLGPDAAKVRFEDMRTLGRNPGAIISAWGDFAEANAGRPMWGVGEPAWPGRSPAELEECRHHECLLNSAFADTSDFQLLCPYDAEGLDAIGLACAFESHPTVATVAGAERSETFRTADQVPDLFEEPLPPAPAHATWLTFALRDLGEVRELVRTRADELGFDPDASHQFVLAVNELAENSVRHGAGQGQLRIWDEHRNLVGEVTDAGHMTDPLIGRRRPAELSHGGYGLWVTHQVCDLVQVRSSKAGTTVRVHMQAPAAALG
jgi:anti-sigma regulatory factor (Ser/Thr protein kinase)